MMMNTQKSLLLLVGLLLTTIHGIAQIELDVSNTQDVETAAFICSKSFHINSFSGAGNTTMNDECITEEVNSVWLNWQSLSIGQELTFTITPDNPDVNLDFILFESDNARMLTNSDPRKCSTSTCEGQTGLRTGAANAENIPFNCNTATDNGFLSPAIQFQRFYALLVHSTSEDNGFTIEFGGNSTFAGPNPSIESSLPNEACYGQEVTFSLPSTFDDTDIISYEWNFGDNASIPTLTTNDRNENPAITYDSLGEKTITLTVESALGCRVETNYTLMIQNCCTSNNSLAVDTTLVKVVSCPSDADGAINIEVTTPSPLPYEVLWSNNETTENISGLDAGIYSVTVSNAAGCEAILEDIVLETPNVLKLEIPNIVLEDCSAGAAIMVQAAAIGGRLPYLYNFGQTQDTLALDNAMLPIGNHLITVKDASGCTDTTTMQVLPLALTPTTANIQNAPCKDSIGSVEINEALGVAPYTYNFGDGLMGGADILEAIPANDYTITVTDSRECTGTVELSIEEPEAFTAFIDGAGFLYPCYGETSASLTVETNGGSGPYTYLWEDGSTNQERDNLAAGTYQVTATDANGCSSQDEGDISQPDSIRVQIIATTTASCTDTQDGSIQLNVEGGTGNYAFSLDNGTTFDALPANSLLTNLNPSDYSLVIQDDNACLTTPITITIDSPTAITSTDSIIDVTNCRENNNGGIIITASGGSGNYTYTFTTPTDTFATNTTGEVLNSLPVGNYTVFISDENGCTTSNDGIEISEATLDVELVEAIDLACNGDNSGTVELSINGATNTADFLFDILNDGTQAGDSILSQLAADIPYEIDVYDANGCQGTAPSFTLTEPEEIRFITPSNRPICFGAADASVAISPSGGTGDLSVSWSTGDTGNTVSNLSAGDYSVTISDENNCSVAAPFSISQNDPILITEIAANDVACPDTPNGSITFDIQGGITPFEYSLDGMNFEDESILSELTADTYTVTIRDAAGCDTSFMATIESPTAIDVLAIGESCYGSIYSFTETITLTDDDNISSLFWEFGEGASTSTITGEGPHEVTYTALGTPEIKLTVTTEKCGEISTYTVNGADNPDSFTLESCCDINGVTLTTTADSTSCLEIEDGRISLEIETDPITLPAAITWDNITESTALVENLAAGTYTVTVTNQADCSATTTATIGAPDSISFTTAITTPSCGGVSDGRITITAMGGTGNYQYDFDGSGLQEENFVDDFPVGNYALRVLDANGCQQIAEITLAEKELTTNPANITQPTCAGDADGAIAITVTNGTGPYEYNLNGNGFEPPTALTDILAGNYAIQIRDADQCLGNINIIVTEPDPVRANMQTVQNISCFGERDGQLRATGSGGNNSFDYAWSVGGTDPLITNLAPGEYTVTVTDGQGCSTTQTGLVVEPPLLTAIATPRPVFCFGQSNGAIIIEGVGGRSPYSYSLDGVFFQPSDAITNLPSGDYTVFVQDIDGCMAEAEATIEEPGEFSIIATQDQEVLLGEEIQLQAIVTDDTGVIYTWSGPDTLSCTDCPNPKVTPSQSGTYFVTATNPGNCTASDTIRVLVNFDRPIYFPQAFTPNGDGINDLFFIQGGSAVSVIRRLSIFDRFGALLYDQTNIQPNNISTGWDGTLNGQALPIGVYVVRADVEFIDGELITYTTDVTLAKNSQ